MSLINSIHLGLGVAGSITELLICLAPIPTFWRIIKHRSTQKFSWLPYATGLLYASYWGCYSLPFITQQNIPLLAVSTAQAAIETTYLVIFTIFAPSKQMKTMVIAVMLSIAASVAGLVTVARIGMHNRPERCMFAGLPAALVTVAMYASPLSIMRLVIETKSVEFMPLLLSLSIFVNALAWTAYGALGRDLFILISEGLGALLGTGQLILYAMYCNSPKVKNIEAVKNTDLKSDNEKFQTAIEV